MQRRWLFIFFTFSGIVLAAFWLYQTRVVIRWLRGEAFYEGRPSSYWAAEIESWECTHGPWFRHCEGWGEFARKPTLPAFIRKIVPEPKAKWPSLLDGDPEGLPVLRELLYHEADTVVQWAQEGIDRMDSGKKGPERSVYLFGRPDHLGLPDYYHLTPDRVHGDIGP